MDFLTRLPKIKAQVWREVQRSLPPPDGLYEKLIWEYPSRQGKYLRPALVILSCEIFGGSIRKSLPIAAAMQLSEEWLLIHDDFEDHSEERRSTESEIKLSLNKLYGDELAVNAGDAVHLIMWKLLGKIAKKLNNTEGWKLFEKLNEVILTATKGQFMELNWIRAKRLNIREKEYFEMISKKTAYYTIIGPLQLGAIAGEAAPKDIKAIEQWGQYLGYVFQLTDDIINIEEKNTTQGKEEAGDILEGKRTLILCHLLSECSEKEKKIISGIYNKLREEKTEEEKRYIVSLMQKYGSISYAKRKAQKYYDKAIELFEFSARNTNESQAKIQLRQCMELIKNRKR